MFYLLSNNMLYYELFINLLVDMLVVLMLDKLTGMFDLFHRRQQSTFQLDLYKVGEYVYVV